MNFFKSNDVWYNLIIYANLWAISCVCYRFNFKPSLFWYLIIILYLFTYIRHILCPLKLMFTRHHHWLFQNEIPLDGTYVFVYFSFKDLGKSHKKLCFWRNKWIVYIRSYINLITYDFINLFAFYMCLINLFYLFILLIFGGFYVYRSKLSVKEWTFQELQNLGKNSIHIHYSFLHTL